MTDEDAYVGSSGKHPGKVCLIRLNSLTEAVILLAISPVRARALATQMVRVADWQEEAQPMAALTTFSSLEPEDRPEAVPLINGKPVFPAGPAQPLPPAEGTHDLSCDVYKLTPGPCSCGETDDNV